MAWSEALGVSGSGYSVAVRECEVHSVARVCVRVFVGGVRSLWCVSKGTWCGNVEW